MANKIAYKRFELEVTAPNQSYTKDFELDKTFVIVRGVKLSADKEEQLYFRGTSKIEINKEEFFPENYLSRDLMSGINVPPNARYHRIGNTPTGNGIIKLVYTDTDDGRTVFSPYKVWLSLHCKIS